MIVYKELRSIEYDLGIPLKTLYGISNNIERHYHEKRIPKSNRETRVLSVPDEVLKKVQRAIVDKLLVYEPVSKYAMAYRIGTNVKKNALCHVGQDKLLKLDIYHFFESIGYSVVKERVFPEEKYSEPIRILLSMLCYKGDSLPQGAPTSPIISNIIMRNFDQTVGVFCENRAIHYTRYCDDMTFSGDFNEAELLDFVSRELKAQGFILNDKKTRCLKNGSKKTVTGVVVNEKINTPKSYRREIRQAIFYCKKYGVEEHLRRIDSSVSTSKYLAGLLGKVNYVLQITPDNQEFSEYRSQLLKLIKDNP